MLEKPNFSCVLITKNEAQTLPRLLKSLEAFKTRGGEVCILDTGSTDETVKIAKDWGCVVREVGEKYLHTITAEEAKAINDHFIVEGEEPVVKAGDRYFDFAAARNESSSLASNDWVSTIDADEEMTVMDIEKINEVISNPNLAHCEYEFVFAHNAWGGPAVQFVQSKFFNRTKMKWEGMVHEYITPINGGGDRQYLPPDIFLLEHWQQPGDRHSYLKGLLMDCYLHPEKDRNSHYSARELVWSGRPKSAIKEFERHLSMGGWPAERSESCIFIGDCYGTLGQPEKQIEYYNRAYWIDPWRRAPFVKLAWHYLFSKQYESAVSYANACLNIPWRSFYANQKGHYEQEPHEILYQSYGWLGDIERAQQHLLKCLEYQPQNPRYLHDTRYYFEYGAPDIDGWMGFDDLTFLYERGKQYKHILELGSWKGRSTHALLTGNSKIEGGTVTSVDTFGGSSDVRDFTNHLAKQEDIYGTFMKNVGHFPNLKVHRMTGVEGSKLYPDQHFDMVFIDAGHTYEEVKEDIACWAPKVKKGGLLAGDDYLPNTWMGVCQAVDEYCGGKPDGVVGKLWYKQL